MQKYLYLFWNNEGARANVSPERMEQLMKAWWGWMEELKKGGNIVTYGERLDTGGKLVRDHGKTVTDGPYAEAKDTVGGYLVIQAKDIDEAIALSKGCPILQSDGGIVEVRPIITM